MPEAFLDIKRIAPEKLEIISKIIDSCLYTVVIQMFM